MPIIHKALLVSDGGPCRSWLERFIDGSDILLADCVSPWETLASVAQRTPDIIVIDADSDQQVVSQVCGALKSNPTTVSLPLLGLARSGKRRLAAFESGVDDFLTCQVRDEEFLVRVRSLLRISAIRRQFAAEQLAEEVRRREAIRDAFRRYISPQLADRILASQELRDSFFGGTHSRVQAAVMFADMRGFTALSERLNPAEVAELLNEFFALLTDITFRFDGTVFNMAGDSLMVGFGVPVEQDDGAGRAVQAARLMLAEFAKLARCWYQRHRVETGLGIGINMGEVIAGNIGSPSYMNYTIIGDTVNVASRLGQRARAGEMLFSNAVKHSLEDQGLNIAALPLPALVLRGRSSPIDIFCVPSAQRIDFRPH